MSGQTLTTVVNINSREMATSVLDLAPRHTPSTFPAEPKVEVMAQEAAGQRQTFASDTQRETV